MFKHLALEAIYIVPNTISHLNLKKKKKTLWTGHTHKQKQEELLHAHKGQTSDMSDL